MVDVLCTDDLDLYGRDIDDPMAELAQDVEHMLLETYGTNADAPTRGIGLEDALSGPVDPSLRHRIETALLEDDRIDAAEVTLTDEEGDTAKIEIQIQADGNALGLVFDVIDGTVTRAAT